MNKELQKLSDLVSSEKDLGELELPKLNELLPFMQAFVKKEQNKLEECIKENNHQFKEKKYRYFKDPNQNKNIELRTEGNKDKIHSPTNFR